MGIEQNYNKNLKKSVKKQMPTLPPNSKFIFQQLLKNSHHIEENLENETMVEYNVGDLKRVIKNILSEKKEPEYDEWEVLLDKIINMDESQLDADEMENLIKDYGVKRFIKDFNKIENPKKRTDIIIAIKKRKIPVDSYEKQTSLKGLFKHVDPLLQSILDDGPYLSEDKKELMNRYYLKERKLLNEAKPCCTKYCWFSPKLGDACDGGDGHKGGRWSNTVNGCACSYDKTADGWDVGGKYVSGGIDKDLSSNDVEVEMGEATTTASSGAYETPKFWAKGKKNHRFAKKRLMPGAKYVKVKDKCKKFPYCNQGDINALEIWEKSIMRESAKNVAKKTGKSESEVREMIEKEISEIIRRSFYKSPVTDLVGGGKMNTPIGKIFTMSGNKPKYES